MCAAMGAEIYDLAWSPDGSYFITGSMDNAARIYNSSTGACIRQIAEHNHYVQGVAWDPLNEYVATQSSDRSVHIYTLKTKDGQFTLDPHSKVSKMDLPARRRISSSSPAPPDLVSRTSAHDQPHNAGSPVPSAPGTPQSLALPMPMNPPPTSHSRRSSFGSSPSIRRSASPAPSLPLPAVMPSNSPRPGMGYGLGVKQANIYANETLPSFFRRLTFATDGSLLFTPAGQYRLSQHHLAEDIINTVYIYTRAGLNKPPIAYLPGHKKASIAVRCSPIFYQLRGQTAQTKQITMDTSGGEEIPALPEPALGHRTSVSSSTMDPPPLTSAPSPSPSVTAASPKVQDKSYDSDGTPTSSNLPPGPTLAFGLPYRMVYAVATQDAVYIYDTQQQKPLCVVSNLHFATFTDLTWYVLQTSLYYIGANFAKVPRWSNSHHDLLRRILFVSCIHTRRAWSSLPREAGSAIICFNLTASFGTCYPSEYAHHFSTLHTISYSCKHGATTASTTTIYLYCIRGCRCG
jgi:chromatin assembly factor 1 subunit B